MKKLMCLAILLGTVTTAPANARKKQVDTWQVMRTSDPITGASTCAVVASDYASGLRFTQVGGLYPVVEKNSDFGLLVGVSSGGRFRVPTGDILWRVDERPHRELKAADNPVAQTASANSPANNNPLTNLTADTLRLASALTATSTMASGDKARQMLSEMLAGQSLLFRSSAAAQLTGIPDYNRLLTGQRTAQGIRPYPLDASFRAALEVCQISSFAAQ